MLAYYEEDIDFTACQAFCELWTKNFPALRADMARILMDLINDNKYNSFSVYSFNVHNQSFDFWKLAFNIIEHVADINDVDMQTIIDTMPSHLMIDPGRILYVHTTIGAVSTAKDILKKYGFFPKSVIKQYGMKFIKQKGN